MKNKKKGLLSIDKLITGIIIGGAAASIFGLSRTYTGKSFFSRTKSRLQNYVYGSAKIFGKISIKLLDLFQKK